MATNTNGLADLVVGRPKISSDCFYFLIGIIKSEDGEGILKIKDKEMRIDSISKLGRMALVK